MKLGLKTITGAGALAAAFCLTPIPTAFAQGSSETTVSTGHFTDAEAATFSKTIERSLAEKGARIAIVFRAGRAREGLPDGINYTHGAFWVYQAFQTPEGDIVTGYNTWNLFHGDGNELPRSRSYLSEEFPFTFVTASAVDDVAIIVPTPYMQAGLLELLSGDDYARLHNPNYSLISNPSDERFQNCVEFLLDVVSAVAWKTTEVAQLKANLAVHFEPSTVEAGIFARLFGPIADERLRLSDHRGQRVQTATFESLAAFMMEHGLADETYRLTFERAQAEPEFG